MKAQNIFKKSVLFSLFLISSLVSAQEARLLVGDRFGFKGGYDLQDYSGKKSFLDFMKSKVYPAAHANYKAGGVYGKGKDNSKKALAAKKGVAVKVYDKNYTWHVNYDTSDNKSGRSWSIGPGGKLDDPSDKDYLKSLWEIVTKGDDKELAEFYFTLANVLGNCDSDGYRYIDDRTEVVATDFISVYIAEQIRRLMPKGEPEWDDALFEVTMLAAFHGGQGRASGGKMKMVYRGKFTGAGPKDVVDQFRKSGGSSTASIYYKTGKLGSGEVYRSAALHDYWQYSSNGVNSGINITRRDFEKMGMKLTTAIRSSSNRDLLANVERIVGKSSNVIQAVARYYIHGNGSVSGKASSVLPEALGRLLVAVRTDAKNLTASIR